MSDFDAYIGLDVHKETTSVAVADRGRTGVARHYGEIPNTPDAVAKLARRLTKQHDRTELVYEAGPCGYTLYRQFTLMG